ncbi:MAG: hypothetical protein R2939_04160 [Kofleriaceae bacterium]
MGRAWLVAWTIGLGACLATPAAPCVDGVVCAAGQVCAPAGGACVDPAQVAACDQRAEGATCTLPGIGAGQCRDGLCVVAGCGDGVVDPGEACDDGNQVADDGCTNACALPTCGDGVRQGDEVCDEGAANGDDRACTSRCLRATCGDNLVRAGDEECDGGAANADDDACTLACTRNVCGDGKVWAGVEACDDGNQVDGDGCRGDCGKLEVCPDGVVDAGEACDDGNGNPVDGCDACAATTWIATALLGGSVTGIELGLASPYGVAVDVDGNVYVADTFGHRVRRIDAGGVTTVVAGLGSPGGRGDGGPATSAEVDRPQGVAVDGLGNVYIADRGNHRVRKVDAGTGRISTVAGTGVGGFGGDGGAAAAAQLQDPTGVALDGLGNVYIADSGNARVRKVTAATGVITTLAGSGVVGDTGDGGLAVAAQLKQPAGVAVAASGDVYIADYGAHRVRIVYADSGVIKGFAGTGVAGYAGDGAKASLARLRNPASVALGGDRLYIADAGNHRVRSVTLGASPQIDSFAGTDAFGYTDGDDGHPARTVSLYNPLGVAVAPSGTVIIADTLNQRIRRVTDGVIHTLAGTGAFGDAPSGAAATSLALLYPHATAVTPNGELFVVDRGNHRVWKRPEGGATLERVAGTGIAGFTPGGFAAIKSRLSSPSGVAIGRDDALYIADTNNHVIRRLAGEELTEVAGTGTAGLGGEGELATASALRAPEGVAFDDVGNMYIADTGNHRVRRVDGATGLVTTIAGDGVAGFGGDGGPPAAARFSGPRAVAVDGNGLVYIADTGNHRVRVIKSGEIKTRAGTGAAGFAGDGGAAEVAQLAAPAGVQVIDGELYIADTDNHRIRRVDADGKIVTVAGTGVAPGATAGDGDGGLATAAALARPISVGLDVDGSLLIADSESHRIRRIDRSSGIITTVAGQITPPGMGPTSLARLADARALAVGGHLALVAGGSTGTVEAWDLSADWLDVVAGRYPQATAVPGSARFGAQTFGAVGGVAIDEALGRIYVAESGNHRIQVVTIDDPATPASWTMAPLVGVAGAPGFIDGALTTARLRDPQGLWLDAASRVLYVADTGNHVVRAIDLDLETIATVAGTPATLGYFGDGLAATDALLFAPRAVTLAPSGDLFIADAGNQRVRRVAADSGTISTVLGDGVDASSGEGAPAASFPVASPRGLSCDALGNLLVTSSTAVRLLPADADGVVDGTGPVQTIYGAAPRTTFPASVSACLSGLVSLDLATTWIADACAGLLVELHREPVAP